MKAFFTFSFLCCILAVQAQMRGTGQIVMLHPSVGNTITLSEKQKFGLFPLQPDSTFGMAQLVKYDDSTYTFIFHSAKDVRTEKAVAINQLLDMYMAVEKIKPAPPMPQVLALAKKEKIHRAPNPNKNEVPLLDAFGNVINISMQVLEFVFDNHPSHHKYDSPKDYYYDPYYEHYIPKDGEDN